MGWGTAKSFKDTTAISTATIALRNARNPGGKTRVWGMMVFVTADNKTYQLKRGLVDNDIYNNANWQEFTGGGGGSDVFIPEAYDASVTDLPPTTYDGAAPTAGCQWHVTVASAADGNGDIAIPEGALIIYIPGYAAGDFADYKIIQA